VLVHLCFCETRWSLSVHDLSMNFTTDKLSVQRKETASRLRRRRAERTRSYWKCFNCFSLHLANVDSNMSGTNHWLMTRFVSPSNICKRTYSCYYINTRINNIVYCTVFIVLCRSIGIQICMTTITYNLCPIIIRVKVRGRTLPALLDLGMWEKYLCFALL